MMFVVLLVPMAVLGLLLGMERIERWTVQGSPEDTAPTATTTGP